MPVPAPLLLLLAAPAPDSTLEELTRAYQQACESRAYGQYDDVCGGLKDQIDRYRAELRRRPPPRAVPPPVPATVPPPAVDAAPVAHEPLKGDPPK